MTPQFYRKAPRYFTRLLVSYPQPTLQNELTILFSFFVLNKNEYHRYTASIGKKKVCGFEEIYEKKIVSTSKTDKHTHIRYGHKKMKNRHIQKEN